MFLWYVPAADEALVISGSKRRQPGTEFRIVTGRGVFIFPVKHKARILSLALHEIELVEDCVTSQGIHLSVRSVVAFKIGNDPASIGNAARRFMSVQNRMEELVGPVFAGHLRAVIGGVTVEQLIAERDRVKQEINKRSSADMERMGIVVDALEILQIEDASGYISDLAAAHAAAVAKQARIAQADADLEAAEREREVAELKATYERDLELKRAGYLAETERVKAEAAQAGPLTEVRISQEVAEQQMALAQRQAEIAALRLDAEVRQSADAEAYAKRAVAEAERDQAKFAADAEAYRMLTIARAETQVAKINAEPAVPVADKEQGRRGRLRPRRPAEATVMDQQAVRRG
jgi:regulator of protease activity HflC (stomatin/prohibitin superfamily)